MTISLANTDKRLFSSEKSEESLDGLLEHEPLQNNHKSINLYTTDAKTDSWSRDHTMAPEAKAEYILEDLAGCGLFQIIFFMSVAFVIKSVIAYSILFMAFGNYNPGWRCLDNKTGGNDTWFLTTAQSVLKNGSDAEKYVIGSCKDFSKCDNVEFNPESSTLVTQWSLLCDDAWILNVVISVQMVGMLLGAYLGGQLSDLIGRKKTVCLGLLICSVSHLASSYSVAWYMFAVFRFMIGLFGSNNLIVMFLFLSEYMSRKWRAIAISVPLWYFGATVLALVAWIFKDWRRVELVGSGLSAFCLLPVIVWAPESLRWLEVKGKKPQFISVSKKVLKLNKKDIPSFENWEFSGKVKKEKEEGQNYTVLDLFRKGYRVITISILFLQFCFSILYYALTFGAKALYGNFYFNLCIMNIIPIPFGFLSMLMMRILSRRWHTIVFLVLTVMCSVVSVVILLIGDQAAKDFGSTILISVAKALLDVAWLGVYARNAELYPTVVRGLGVGFGSMAARTGGILAPFLIPDDKSVLYIFMIIMTVVAVLCCFVSLYLPETKGKILKERFSDKEEKDGETIVSNGITKVVNPPCPKEDQKDTSGTKQGEETNESCRL